MVRANRRTRADCSPVGQRNRTPYACYDACGGPARRGDERQDPCESIRRIASRWRRRASRGGAVDILPRVFPSHRRIVAPSPWPAAGTVDSEDSVTVNSLRRDSRRGTRTAESTLRQAPTAITQRTASSPAGTPIRGDPGRQQRTPAGWQVTRWQAGRRRAGPARRARTAHV